MIGDAVLPASWGFGLLILFSIAWIALGLYWGRKAKGLDGYTLAGRNVGLALGSATAVATWVTSNTTMLAPLFALQLGIWGMLAYSTASIGLFLFAPMAERIRKLMPRGFTAGEFIRLRYGRGAYLVFVVISLFYALTWMVSLAMAGGTVLEALSGIPYLVGMSTVLLVCVIYTLFGGMFAVIGTDFIQSCIILVGVVILGVASLDALEWSTIYQTIEVERPALLEVMFPAALMAIFNNLLFGLGEIFHSNVWWSRAFAMREGVGRKAYVLGGILWLPIPVAAGFVALAAPALGVNVPRPDMVGPLVAATLLGKVGAVVIFVVVFASLASSVDSLLAATSDLITHDVIRPFLSDRSPERLRKVGSRVIIGLGVFTWLVCLPRIGTLATVLFFAGALVGSTIWPIAAGLYWRQVNPAGAMWAMILGSVTGLIGYVTIAWYVAALIGTTVSMVVLVATTVMRPRAFAWSRLAEGEEAAPA